MVIHTCGIISVFCPYQSALSQTRHGCGFEDSTGQGWFPEATPFFRGRGFKFVDLSDVTAYLLFTCLLQDKKCLQLYVSARSQVRGCGFSGVSLDIRKIQSVADIELLLVDSSTIKNAHPVSKII